MLTLLSDKLLQIKASGHHSVKETQMSPLLSPLFHTSSGQGRPLLLLHGWGMNQQIWQPVQAELAVDNQVTLPDLPGHGQSRGEMAAGLNGLVSQLAILIQPETIVIGWSLGGLLAQALAHAYPEKIKGLVLVASTPRFVQSDDWQHGLPVSVLQDFAANLQQDYQATIKRFFALQFMGVRHDPAEQRLLQQAVLANPADPIALQQGLDILASADFTAQRPNVPTLWLMGRLDRLIPVSLAQEISQWGEHNQVTVLPWAAHVPFVTHRELFLDTVLPFIRAVHGGSLQ